MTQTNDTTPEDSGTAASAPARKRSGGLNGMLLADLRSMAGGLGIRGGGSMKKAQLVEAIKAAQGGASGSGRPSREESVPGERPGGAQASAGESAPRQAQQDGQAPQDGQPQQGRQRDRGSDAPEARAAGSRDAGQGSARERRSDDRGPQEDKGQRPQSEREQGGRSEREQGGQSRRGQGQSERGQGQSERGQGQGQSRRDQGAKDQAAKDQAAKDQGGREQGRDQGAKDQGRDQGAKGQQQSQQQPQAGGDDDEAGSRRNRRRRGRDRDRSATRTREPDTSILEDDVLVPAAGILDVLENYAFVRTTGYLPGPDDVYVSLSMVRKHGLRRGDAVVGQVRQPREGERREKFNPLVRIDSINGADPEAAQDRPDFDTFTPVHPDERLRLETDPTNTTGRVIDLVAPLGKGQRGLVVSPPKAGRTTVLRSVAASITANNPECHLMVVLIDERPEEVTDFQRSIKGEVIASTFDRPASDHTMLAELALERAKRLVELGHDVVVLLDSLTHLGRAYNLAAPASGRILSGGVDSSALYPPKKFFGAARNVEDGGSLTILATGLVETGSKMDEVIFEEFAGTGNLELRLRRELAEKRIFPAIDPVQSATRREELLMSAEEQAIMRKLRRVLADHEPQEALELLLEKLRATQTNIEFLTQVQRAAPGAQER